MAAALAAYPLPGAGRLAPLLGLVGGAGLGAALAAPHVRARLTGPALFALATEYVLAESAGRVPAVSVTGYAAGLIVMAELLLWAGQLPRRGRADWAVAAAQAVTLAVLALAGAVLALAALAVAGLRLPGVWTGALVGMAAAAALLALPLLLLRSTATRGPDS